MQYTLEHIGRRWGSAEGYLMAHGLAADALATLRELLTEPLS
jgi:hypothetical protein